MAIFNFIFLSLLLLLLLLPMAIVSSPSLAKPDCQSKCGNISNIPYPFGIGKNCYGPGKWYEILCNSTGAFLKSFNIEVLNISLPLNSGEYIRHEDFYVEVNIPIIHSDCSGEKTSETLNLTGSPFYFSEGLNTFASVGCNTRALMSDNDPAVVSGCQNLCVGNGGQWCQTSLPAYLQLYKVDFDTINNTAIENGEEDECKLAFIVKRKWFESHLPNHTDMLIRKYVPAMLVWWIFFEPKISEREPYYCDNYTFGFQCYCKGGFEGNAYLENGCQDVNECEDPKLHWCPRNYICENTYGSYRCRVFHTQPIFIGLGLVRIGLGFTLNHSHP